MCNSYGTRRPAAEVLPVDAVTAALAPRFGARFAVAANVARRGAWPTADPPVIRDLTGRLAAPIVLIGNEFDPATPMSWTRDLAQALGMERHVIRYQGGGHGAYATRGLACIDAAIEPYLFDPRPPPVGFSCPARPVQFGGAAQ